jgi:RimJ/RimL family protein N-acetyltransferase
MSLVLRAIGLNERDLVAAIEVEPDQARFSGGSVDEIFDRMAAVPRGQHPFALADGNNVVGLLVLREADALPGWAEPGCVSLHNFRFDRRFQARGLGRTALRLAGQWVAQARPAVTHVMASINVVNVAALRLALGCGLAPTGRIVEGRIGPEIVMAARTEHLGISHAASTRTL